MSDSPPALAPLELALPGEHVVGFPLFCALTVRCSRASAELVIPEVDVIDDGAVVGFTLEDPAGKVLLARVRTGAVDEDRVTLVTLHPGESRRMLIDLSASFTEDPPLGAHRLRVRYSAPIGTTESAAHDLLVRAPTEVEMDMLGALDPNKPASMTWGRYLVEPGPTTAIFQPNVARFLAQPPLRLVWLLRSMIGGDSPDLWERTTIDRLAKDADAWLVPEREALWAELLALRSDPSLPQHIAQVRTDHPALDWWMRALEQGTSNLSALRSAFGGMLAS
jgi:hypothetical protein